MLGFTEITAVDNYRRAERRLQRAFAMRARCPTPRAVAAFAIERVCLRTVSAQNQRFSSLYWNTQTETEFIYSVSRGRAPRIARAFDIYLPGRSANFGSPVVR